MTELETAFESIRNVKESAHRDDVSMIPIVEVMRDGELIAVIGMAPFETFDEKEEAFTQCLYAARSIKGDTVRLMIDAHMSKYAKEDYDPDNIVMPSQDPKAVDVILGYEWKDGKPVESIYQEYHNINDGTLQWNDIKSFPQDDVESWMNDKVAWAYENPLPTLDDVMVLGEFMAEKGHIFALMGELDVLD
jgi:hypothetical protein